MTPRLLKVRNVILSFHSRSNGLFVNSHSILQDVDQAELESGLRKETLS